jgi:hypothetical protein
VCAVYPCVSILTLITHTQEFPAFFWEVRPIEPARMKIDTFECVQKRADVLAQAETDFGPFSEHFNPVGRTFILAVYVCMCVCVWIECCCKCVMPLLCLNNTYRSGLLCGGFL